MTMRFMVAALLLGLATGCTTLRKSTPDGATATGPDGETLVQIEGKEDASKKVMANLDKPYQSPLGEIPLDVNPLTEQWIRYFQGRGRRYMEVYLERSTRYLPMMKNTLRENGLPEDLVYVALIESGFSPTAHSHSNAVGYWQFIRGTGRRYGLMLDSFIDERRDPVLSTRAAAQYFRALYNLFGSWHLALAAYNVGENRVKHAVMKNYTRDFWELVKKRRSFPKETKHYVPKFIAAAIIARDPEKYGFKDIKYQSPLAFDTVSLVNPISMTKFAAASNVDLEELKLLNPKFRGDYVPQYRGSETIIRVPVGKASEAVAAIPNCFSAQPKVVAADFYFYRVRSGDSLSTIAHRHRTSISTLRRLNGLGSRSFLRAGSKLKVPDRGGSFVTYEMPADDSADNDSANSERDREVATTPDSGGETAAVTETHVVRRGETLTAIARKYGLTVNQLRHLNKLSARSVLRRGQTLKLKNLDKPEDTEKAGNSQNSKREGSLRPRRALAKISKSTPKTRSPLRHRVRRGETLAEIAQNYRISVGVLAKHNLIKNRSRLLAGSELIIPSVRAR